MGWSRTACIPLAFQLRGSTLQDLLLQYWHHRALYPMPCHDWCPMAGTWPKLCQDVVQHVPRGWTHLQSKSLPVDNFWKEVLGTPRVESPHARCLADCTSYLDCIRIPSRNWSNWKWKRAFVYGGPPSGGNVWNNLHHAIIFQSRNLAWWHAMILLRLDEIDQWKDRTQLN